MLFCDQDICEIGLREKRKLRIAQLKKKLLNQTHTCQRAPASNGNNFFYFLFVCSALFKYIFHLIRFSVATHSNHHVFIFRQRPEHVSFFLWFFIFIIANRGLSIDFHASVLLYAIYAFELVCGRRFSSVDGRCFYINAK